MDHNLPYHNPALPVEQRVEDLLSRMTLPEKVAQLSGVWLAEVAVDGVFSPEKARVRLANGIGQITRPAGGTPYTPDKLALDNNAAQAFLATQTRLGIPAIVHEECCCGLMARWATTFPQLIGLASTWNPELAEAMTAAIRAQMRAVGDHQGLSPILDISRDPRWGRVEETFGEDPYLAARMGTAYVRGLQGPDLKVGIAATGKHFAGHGLAEGGLNWAPVHLGPREFREVFLYTFEAAIKEGGLASIMNAYHELDGVPCGSSKELLTNILRDEWGFPGVVVSDYNAVVMLVDYHRIAADKGEAARLALEAGLDIELPATDCYGEPLMAAIQAGKVAISVVDTSVRRILALKFRLGLFEGTYVDPGKANLAYRRPEDTALSRRVAQESLVLLKNEGSLLPLKPNTGSIAVIGPNATVLRHMFGDYSYSSFIDLMDGGSQPPEKTAFPEHIPPMKSILEAIQDRVSPETRLRYAEGCSITGTSREGFAEAVAAARASDVAILVMGGKSSLCIDGTCGELRDRATLGLLGVQTDLVNAVVDTGTPVVLVLVDGRPAAIPDLAECIPSILEAWLPAEEGGPAIAAALFGNTSPGGKLPVSFPRSSGQIPVYYRHKPSGGTSYNFEDYVDLSSKPLFPFGHGLSYTQFEYQDLQITPAQVSPDNQVSISLTVKNTGSRSGDEVVQLYVRDSLSTVTRPVKELKGFLRVTLDPGQPRTLTFTLSVAQLAFYNREMEYVVEPGKIEVMLGSSSADIRLSGQFEIVGEVTPITRKVFFSRVSLA